MHIDHDTHILADSADYRITLHKSRARPEEGGVAPKLCLVTFGGAAHGPCG